MLKSAAWAMVGMIGLTVPAAAGDVREAIEQANWQFVEAFKAGDAATIASLYTDTAEMLPPRRHRNRWPRGHTERVAGLDR